MATDKRCKQLCIPFSELGEVNLSSIKEEIKNNCKVKKVFFKDQLVRDEREICFSHKKYSKDEVNPYTTDITIRGFRKLGVKVIGIGELKEN